GTETAARARPRRESLCYSVVAPTGDPGSYQSNDGPPGPSACPRQRYGRKAMIDSSRRTVLTTGAAAAATAAAPQVFAQAPQTSAPQGAPAGAKTGYYEKGNVRIRYTEIGTGFPLLATPGGGLNSRIAVWANAGSTSRRSSRTTSASSPWTSVTPRAASPPARCRSTLPGARSPTTSSA